MAITLRVYDSGKKYKDFADRYALYVPTPRNKVREWGFMGMYLGFNFNEEGKTIHRECWGDCKNGIKTMSMGKKIKRDTLPLFVQEWVNGMEEAYNKALTEDTEEAWEAWNRC